MVPEFSQTRLSTFYQRFICFAECLPAVLRRSRCYRKVKRYKIISTIYFIRNRFVMDLRVKLGRRFDKNVFSS
jgi:hypothetical protein